MKIQNAKTYPFLFVPLVLGIPTILCAEVKLASIFSDHMVLQQSKPVSVWGWADPGEQITVKFANQTKTTTAKGRLGKWLVKLDPMEASGTPRTLQVHSKQQDRPIRINNVLVGEVWLGSGQSNMAMTVARARDFEAEQPAANLPVIRMFKETSGGAARPQTDSKGAWTVCSPQTVGAFSATLYFFGRELHKELQIPIGLINSSVGGTPIESWIASDAQAKTPPLKESHQAAVKAYREFDVAKAQARYQKALVRWRERAAKARAAGNPVPRRPVNQVNRRKRRSGPGGLFNGKIAPLIPYAMRGAIWYQGEANSQPGKGHLYQYQLPLLVQDWRKRWGEGFPFAWVQLPNFEREGEGWMLVREGMLKTLRLPHTGMAITVDIGEPKDIHPKNKQDVGRRLAAWALGDVYKKKGVATSGPLPMKHKIRSRDVIISFRHTNGGLIAKGGPLKGFVIAGEDANWKSARAKIAGDTVIVSHPEITKPVAVRYAWEANPQCNLYNGAGLPASPFRTDDDVQRPLF